MVREKHYAELFKYDQLAREMKEKRVFIGFREGQCNFAPTFKVLRAVNITF